MHKNTPSDWIIQISLRGIDFHIQINSDQLYGICLTVKLLLIILFLQLS